MAALCALVLFDNTLKIRSHQSMTVGIVDTIVYAGQSHGILLGTVLFTLSQTGGTICSMLHLDINHVVTL